MSLWPKRKFPQHKFFLSPQSLATDQLSNNRASPINCNISRWLIVLRKELKFLHQKWIVHLCMCAAMGQWVSIERELIIPGNNILISIRFDCEKADLPRERKWNNVVLLLSFSNKHNWRIVWRVVGVVCVCARMHVCRCVSFCANDQLFATPETGLKLWAGLSFCIRLVRFSDSIPAFCQKGKKKGKVSSDMDWVSRHHLSTMFLMAIVVVVLMSSSCKSILFLFVGRHFASVLREKRKRRPRGRISKTGPTAMMWISDQSRILRNHRRDEAPTPDVEKNVS